MNERDDKIARIERTWKDIHEVLEDDLPWLVAHVRQLRAALFELRGNYMLTAAEMNRVIDEALRAGDEL